MVTRARTNTILIPHQRVVSPAELLLQPLLSRRPKLRFVSVKNALRPHLRSAFVSGRTESLWAPNLQPTTRSVRSWMSRTAVVPLHHRTVSHRRKCLVTALKTLIPVGSMMATTLRKLPITLLPCLR